MFHLSALRCVLDSLGRPITVGDIVTRPADEENPQATGRVTKVARYLTIELLDPTQPIEQDTDDADTIKVEADSVRLTHMNRQASPWERHAAYA
ncbi:hypothetical protein GCM10027160_23830 [Streptomyces calidiresistens]|uniref:Uncharacterized protein n=1 Tax=Streptomyces calidiresistens TaxID=1485586 RepID=A0A7W3XXX8_9ACTN|nr:hypothetical protein [Streptomyces calidiresistens]